MKEMLSKALCKAKAGAKAIGALVAGWLIAYGVKKGLPLPEDAEPWLAGAAAGVIVWILRNRKCPA